MAFPAVTLLDSLERTSEEKPISKGGQSGSAGEWAKPSWYSFGGKCLANNKGWNGNNFSTGTEYGAYWTLRQYLFPALRWELNSQLAVAERTLGLWICLQGTEHSGYRASFTATGTEAEENETEGPYTVSATKVVGGVETSLVSKTEVKITAPSYLGFTKFEKKIQLWYGQKASMAVIAEVEDATYTKGYVGFFADGSNPHFKNIEVGSNELQTHQGMSAPSQKSGISNPQFKSGEG